LAGRRHTMNKTGHWLSRITPRAGIGWKELARLGSLDPYGQHQVLCQLFDLPPKEQRSEKSTPFLFRAERIEPASALGYAHPDLAGLPVFYVLSQQKPENRSGVWQIEARQYRPDLLAGDRLAFKLRVNPVVTRKTERGRRHDVVMDTKLKMDWRNLPPEQRPTHAQLAYDAGSCWLLGRAEKLGCEFDASTLSVDGHDTWRQRHGKKIKLSTLDFEGVLLVTEPDCFLGALLNGLGPAKVFGCGLMLVKRI
jgi:CRISPR system Cascade subunit CasE